MSFFSTRQRQYADTVGFHTYSRTGCGITFAHADGAAEPERVLCLSGADACAAQCAGLVCQRHVCPGIAGHVPVLQLLSACGADGHDDGDGRVGAGSDSVRGCQRPHWPPTGASVFRVAVHRGGGGECVLTDNQIFHCVPSVSGDGRCRGLFPCENHSGRRLFRPTAGQAHGACGCHQRCGSGLGACDRWRHGRCLRVERGCLWCSPRSR